MNNSLNGLNCVVTGSSRGIGNAIALKFATQSPNLLVVVYKSNQEAASKTVDELKVICPSCKVICFQADLSDSAQVLSVYENIVGQYGKLDVLVNCAGHYLNSMVDQQSDAQFHSILQTNLHSVYFMSREFVKNSNDGGSIINIGSVLTKNPIPGSCAHVMSKGAIEAFSRALAVELGPRKIRVNTVSPGYTKTDALDSSFGFAKDASVFKRVGEPSEIAELVCFLATSASGWITGNNITCSGGNGFSL